MENILQLDSFHLEDIVSKKHGSAFIKAKAYELLIVRLFNKVGKKITPFNLNFVIKNREFWHFAEDKFTKISKDELFEILDRPINDIMDNTYTIFEKVEKLENRFYSKQNLIGFNQTWFLYKSLLVKIQRIASKATTALSDFYNSSCKDDDAFAIKIADLIEHLQRVASNCSSLLENLDTLYSVYSTYSEEKLQSNIYLLTLISGIFLPLNLLVGFFGMNVSSLPFTNQGDGPGVYVVVFIMTIIVLILALLIKKINKNSSWR
ncbi:CorA family divalent cation transporter [uncultured Campylobacter sp.]|uniref:CorA family divalent cation transporter n=1 Tax=uncultured Campylobacter sp. TaxID=218934 RepID=UPI002633D156|nr:CorA family divalent cation transporter [uncultured Campylobacter sp.]